MKKAFIADFGAGNTSLYSVVIGADIPQETALNDPNGEPSGYGLGARGDFRLGLGLYGLDFEDLAALEEFRINIKAIPNDQNSAEMTAYFRAWLEKVQRERPEEFEGLEEHYWLIGCPTGSEWKKQETRDRYRRIFEDAGFRNVFIIPESNAAMAFYQKTAGAMNEVDPETGIVLLDQGAYSLDATHFSGGELSSVGSYLGAGLVEMLILHTILYVPEEKYRQDRREHNLPETLQFARSLYEDQGEKGRRFRSYMLLKARMLKEDYFGKLRSGTLNSARDLKLEVMLKQDEEPMILYTNIRMMQDVLYKLPIRSILGKDYETMLHAEVRRELEGRGDNPSWMQAFENFLCRLDAQYGVFSNAARNGGRARKPKILITGGGSMMSCVSQAIIEHYPNASIYSDPDPIKVIARGMAFWAPDKIRADAFEKAFHEELFREERDEDGDMVYLITTMCNAERGECLQSIVNQIIDEEIEAVFAAINDWKEYRCDSSAIPDRIEAHVKNWCKGKGIQEAKKTIDSHVEFLKKQVNDRFRPLLHTYGMGSEQLLTEDNEVFLCESKEFISTIFELISAHIAEHYQQTGKLWDSFPNPRKGILSNKRASFADEVAQAIAQYLDKETDGTLEICNQLFVRKEFEAMGDNLTFGQRFVIEAVYDIQNMAQERRKKLLGKLVLEEYLED